MQADQWDCAVEDIGPRLYRYFKHKGAGEHVGDLVQECFVRLVAKARNFDPHKGPLIAFAFGIANNVWLESLRSKKKDYSTDNDLASEDLSDQIENADRARHLRKEVAKLPPPQPDVVYLYFDEELTTREIGEALRMPEGTVKSHLHRAKENLRTVLEKEWA